MIDNIYLGRHEPNFNKHIAYMQKKQRLIGLIPRDIKQNDLDEDSISISVIYKTMFAFGLYHNEKLVGLLAVDKIDWENRNFRLQAGLFEEYSALINDELISYGLNLVLDFCKSELRLRRVWSIISEKDFGFEAAKSVFNIEGKTRESGLYYMGCVLN